LHPAEGAGATTRKSQEYSDYDPDIGSRVPRPRPITVTHCFSGKPYKVVVDTGCPISEFTGNSHYLMLEKNSMEIAGVVADWLGRRVTPAEAKEATTGR
jgi:hypothetical protein